MRNTLPSIRTNVLFALTGATALWVTVSRLASATSPTPNETAEAQRWAAANFEKGTPELRQTSASTPNGDPFFSFTYNGRPSAEVLKTWTFQRNRQRIDEKKTQHTLTYTDPATGVVLRCVGVMTYAKKDFTTRTSAAP